MRIEVDAPTQFHLDKFDTISINLEHLDIEVDDEDTYIRLACPLPPYTHYRETMLYALQ